MGGHLSHREPGQDGGRSAASPNRRRIIAGTIGYCLRSSGCKLTAHCPHCFHYAALDLNALAARFGRRRTLDELKPLLRCTRCGGSGKLMVVYDAGPAPSGGHPKRKAPPASSKGGA